MSKRDQYRQARRVKRDDGPFKNAAVPIDDCPRPGVHRWKGNVCLDCTNGTRPGDKRSADEVELQRAIYTPHDTNRNRDPGGSL